MNGRRVSGVYDDDLRIVGEWKIVGYYSGCRQFEDVRRVSGDYIDDLRVFDDWKIMNNEWSSDITMFELRII